MPNCARGKNAIMAEMHSVDEARQLLVELAKNFTLSSENIAIENACGRVLAEDIVAPFDVPGFENSAMDGYAMRGADLPTQGEKSFALAGVILAGGADSAPVATDSCIRITTGAPLPRGADTVVMKENTRVDGEQIRIAAGTSRGANVRPAGEDYRTGDKAILRGTRLTPAGLGALASFGMTTVNVIRRPRAVLLTTGDELVAPGKKLGFGQIHDSNRYSLGSLIEYHGIELLRHERIVDDPAALRDALSRASSDADLIFSSGGVSAGEADFMPRLIEQIGKVHLWKVRMRPGMPFLCGQVNDALVFALPGNPVSGIVTFLMLVRPVLDVMSGSIPRPTLRARLTETIRKRHPRAEFQRARLTSDENATLWAQPIERQGSGMLRGVVDADALIALPHEGSEFAEGSVVEVIALPGWPSR
jgi:molybdopterin molybdotransferase